MIKLGFHHPLARKRDSNGIESEKPLYGTLRENVKARRVFVIDKHLYHLGIQNLQTSVAAKFLVLTFHEFQVLVADSLNNAFSQVFKGVYVGKSPIER